MSTSRATGPAMASAGSCCHWSAVTGTPSSSPSIQPPGVRWNDAICSGVTPSICCKAASAPPADASTWGGSTHTSRRSTPICAAAYRKSSMP
ncbi:hypothetical protein [Ramlibacter ginsenosidimutans]|uniref:hypothetical protein n=1 Tax=Ramlibacter ginsenosidimutans TaxID=502333 RepID=UPI00366FC3B6